VPGYWWPATIPPIRCPRPHRRPINSTVSASEVTYLVGDGGSVLHFNGVAWLPFATPFTSALRSTYGAAAQNVYVAGDNGVVLLGTGP
jgi:hypothetical protein